MTMAQLENFEDERLRIDREAGVLRQKRLVGINDEQHHHKISFEKLVCANMDFRDASNEGSGSNP
jgi:hypothetical protein